VPAALATAGTTAKPRIHSLDAIRTVAILGVVAIHCDPFTGRMLGPEWTLLGSLIDLLSRFAVPFFLVTAGYFLGVKSREGRPPLLFVASFAWRLLGLTLFWYAFYIFWPVDWQASIDHGFLRVAYWNATSLFGSASRLLDGPRVHLWFLSALLIGGLHIALLWSTVRTRFVIFYVVALYALGLTNGAYSAIPEVAAFNPSLSGRLALPPLLIALGWSVATRSNLVRPAAALTLFLTGTALFVGEAWFLHQAYGVPLSGHDFLLGTPLQAVGLLALAVAHPDWGAKTPLPTWGRYTLGVYAAHVAVMEALGARAPGDNLAWEASKPLFVYVLTLALVVGLSRIRVLRRVML